MTPTPITPPAPPAPKTLPPRLTVQNGRLTKPNGAPIFLHGVNFGSWGEDQAEDCAPIHDELGANALRECLRFWGKWGLGSAPNPDSRDPDGFAQLKRANLQHWIGQIRAAGAAKLWSVPFIDSNCGQSGTNTAEDVAYCDRYGTWGERGHNFYTDPSMRKLFATIVWSSVALALRQLEYIAMLEIHPEPAHHRGPEWSPLVAQVHKECIDAIRAAEASLGDPITPILCGAREGYDIRYVEEALLALQDAYGGTLPANLVWTGNLLNQWVVDPPRFDKGLRHLTDLRDAYGCDVFVQQLGRNSSEDVDLSLMRRAIAAMREAEVGYTWWQWKQNTSNPDNMGLNYKNPDDPSGLTWIPKQGELDVLREDWKEATP